jgi:ElaA protein
VNWTWRAWTELSTEELYGLLQLRQAVFVVEQDCAYLDADGLDARAWHLLGRDGRGLMAYARCFPPGVCYEAACIGRVVTSPQARGEGLGRQLMDRAISGTSQRWPGPIQLSAQAYLERFYQQLGFSVCGPGYLEDGIPHLPMRRD